MNILNLLSQFSFFYFFTFKQCIFISLLKNSQERGIINMSINSLIVDDNLDDHQLINDIISINFKDIKIDKALDVETFYEKMKDPTQKYNFIIISADLKNEKGKSAVSVLFEEFPEKIKSSIIIKEEKTHLPQNILKDKNIPVFTKPFSLDEMCNQIKKICNQKV
jgi:DNA-binding NtrC family response regulator